MHPKVSLVSPLIFSFFLCSIFPNKIKIKLGILLKERLLPRNPTIADMTPRERNFALKIQYWLDLAPNPVDRQLIVECLIILAKVAGRNPEVKMNDVIKIDEIVEEAVKACWASFQPDLFFFFFFFLSLFCSLIPF